MVLLVVFIFVVWYVVGKFGVYFDFWFFMNGNYFVLVFMFVILVIVIVCFCVLGFVILIVVMVVIGIGVNNGIFIKGGEVLECVY